MTREELLKKIETMSKDKDPKKRIISRIAKNLLESSEDNEDLADELTKPSIFEEQTIPIIEPDKLRVYEVTASGRCMNCNGSIFIGAEDYDEALKIWEEEIFKRAEKAPEYKKKYGVYGTKHWKEKYQHEHWDEPYKEPVENIYALRKGIIKDDIWCN